MTKSNNLTVIGAVMAFGAALTLAGCDQGSVKSEAPAAVDEAVPGVANEVVEDAKEAVDEAVEAVEEKAEEAAGHAMEAMEEKTDEAMDAVEGAKDDH